MKKFFCIILATLLAGTFTACGETNKSEEIQEESNDVAEYENEAELGAGEIRVNGFESQKDLDTLLLYGYNGKMTLEKAESNYIKSGSASAKLAIMPDVFGGAPSGSPKVYLSTKNLSRGVNCMDFRNVKKISILVYNAQETDERLGLQLIYRPNYRVGDQSEIAYSVLSAKSWTRVDYTVFTASIPEVSTALRGDDRNGEGQMILRVTGVQLYFNRPAATDNEKIFYFDDFLVSENAK